MKIKVYLKVFDRFRCFFNDLETNFSQFSSIFAFTTSKQGEKINNSVRKRTDEAICRKNVQKTGNSLVNK